MSDLRERERVGGGMDCALCGDPYCRGKHRYVDWMHALLEKKLRIEKVEASLTTLILTAQRVLEWADPYALPGDGREQDVVALESAIRNALEVYDGAGGGRG